MVLKLREDLRSCYDEIVKASLKGGTTVMILVSNNIDAMSAAKILIVISLNLVTFEARCCTLQADSSV